MTITRHILATLTAAALLAGPAASHAETIRIGLPTKTYWPTTVAEAAKAQKLFEREGITAELTIYRGGAETFEALAAGAADLILDAPSLPAAGRSLLAAGCSIFAIFCTLPSGSVVRDPGSGKRRSKELTICRSR